MSALARKINANFAARKSRVVTVPEWGVDIHVFPLTLGQLSRINEEKDPMKRLVQIILVRSRKEDGTLLFDAEDAEALMAEGVGPYGPDVVMRVCAEMGVGEFANEAAAEKN